MKLCIQTTSDLLCIRLSSRLKPKIVITDNLDSEDSSYCFVFIEAVRGKKFTHSSFAGFSNFFLTGKEKLNFKSDGHVDNQFNLSLKPESLSQKKKFSFVAESRFCVLPPLIVSPPGAFYGPSNILDYTRKNEDMKRFSSY